MQEYKPTFYYRYHLIRSSLFLLVFPPVFMSIPAITFATTKSFLLSGMALLLFVSLAALPFTFILKALYQKASFKIYSGHVEYQNAFFGLRISEVKFQNLKQISLRQGPLQKLFGLGTILLQSHASPMGDKGGSGLRIYNIQNSEELYKELKQKIS